MTGIKASIALFNRINRLLSLHGLAIERDCIVDTTLPVTHHVHVCSFNPDQMSAVRSAFDIAEVKSYVLTGRANRIQKFEQEQAAAHAWANRPLHHVEPMVADKIKAKAANEFQLIRYAKALCYQVASIGGGREFVFRDNSKLTVRATPENTPFLVSGKIRFGVSI